MIPTSVVRYLNRLYKDSKRLSSRIPLVEQPKSFGVFLGNFDSPPTLDQTRLLSQWDVVVLNPSGKGVLDALATCQSVSAHILGRLDVSTLTKSPASMSSDEVVKSLGVVTETLDTQFVSKQSSCTPFTGVLLANTSGHFQPAVLNKVARIIKRIGFDVWLEMSPPAYLSEYECREINMAMIRGVVCRNGTIRPDGDRQNYFQMTEMRTAMRTIAAQRVPHGPPLMMWETVEDGLELQYAVVKRTFDWCRYNSVLCWIGHTDALSNAEATLTDSILDKPLGALMWLKGDDIMKAHDSWRSNDRVSCSFENHQREY